MEKVKIIPLNSREEEAFYQLAAEYLPDSEQEQMRQYYKLFPKAYLVLLRGEEVIGVAFGWDRKLKVPEDDSFELNGIAVRHDYQKKGYGKLLLQAFERAAYDYGVPAVSLGSAGGYVEKFYMDCGYIPVEYKYWDNGVTAIEKKFENIEDYSTYVRCARDGFVVMYKSVEECVDERTRQHDY